VSQNRAARILKVDRKTIVRRFRYLSFRAIEEHRTWQNGIERSKLRLTDIQFDDLETSIHSKCKPVSVALAVDKKTRKILSFKVSQMPSKGRLVHKSRTLYGRRPDQRKEGWEQMMGELANLVHPLARIRSDQNPKYPPFVKKYFPHAAYETVKGRRGCITGQGELKTGGFDPLFSLNHTCAMFRANINRLFRKTWCTSKNMEGLLGHIALYVRYHNEQLTTELSTQA
jgi:hypothetical protein